MITVGLVGGIASGKSLVAEHFGKLGAHILDADKAGHDVLLMQPVIDKLVERWGPRILNDEQIDRSAIARIVFAQPIDAVQSDADHTSADSEGEATTGSVELTYLESVTHPAIAELLSRQIDEVREIGECPVIVLDAAVMFKAGWDKICERVIFVDSPVEQREIRAISRGWTKDQFHSRERSQLPLDEKKRRSDIVIDNSGSIQKTHKQVEEVWHSLLQMA